MSKDSFTQYRKKGDLPTGHNWEDYYKKFKFAKRESTLAFMYKGAEKKAANLPFSEQVVRWILIDIYFAFSKRQEELDNSFSVRNSLLNKGISFPNGAKTQKSVRSIGIPSMDLDIRCRQEMPKLQNMSPEKQLSYLLNQVS